eukprot:g2583.t1
MGESCKLMKNLLNNIDVFNGQKSSAPDIDADDSSSVAEQQMQQQAVLNESDIDDWVKANGVLYDVLYLRTKGVAASLVKKHKPQPRARGDGYRVWSDLIDKFQPDDQQYRRELIAELNSISMKEGTDPDIFLAEVQDLANKLEYLGEGVSDARLADIVLQGLPSSYDQLRLMADMDSGFTFAKIKRTARNMYKSHSRGRQQQRHGHQRDTHAQAAVRQAATTSSRGATAGQADNPAAATPETATSAAASTHQASTAPSTASPQEATEPYSGSVGFSWLTATDTTGGKDELSVLVDSGASAHFVDSDLIPDLRDCLESYQELQPPMIITTAGMRRVYGKATGVLPCVVVDTDGLERQVSSTQQAHPKTTVHKATEPLGCVYTDVIGPVSPVAKGGYMYVSKFTDEVTRYKAFYLIRSKTEAIDTLVRFVQDLAIPYGRRVVRLRSDGGGEYRAGYFQKYCKQTGIIQEFTATNTPQQNGISERDGRIIVGVIRCLLQGSNLPGWLWGEVCCTAVYLVNRLPHSALGFHTPYFKMFGEQAALSHLRVVGARAFVHYEHHREKLQDRAWEGRLVGYSKDSRAYRIYNPATRRVVESRNVTFIETPDAPVPPAAADTRGSSFPPDADSRGDVCFGDDSDNDSSVDSGGDGDIESDADADVDEDPIEPDGHHRRPPDGTERQLRSKGRLPSAAPSDLSAMQRRALRQLAFSVSSNATAPLVPPASIPTPNTFKQAMASPFRSKWKGAMEKELQSLMDHEVADLVTVDTLPPGASPIGSRWVFKMKPDGTFKTRLVVQGYGQRHGIDCGGTFAPVCRISSQRTLLCIAASKGLHVEHLDVKTAFLNAPVDEDVWVYQAPGFEDNHPVTGKLQVLKLRKSLYGLRQSPRNWNHTFARAIESIGFKSIYSDPCVYVYGSGNEYVVLSIYVDDVLLLGVDPSVVKNIREQLMNKFSMTNLGSASLVLGMEIEQGDGYIKVSQGNFVNSILRKFDFHDSNPAPTPGVGKPLQSNPDGAASI